MNKVIENTFLAIHQHFLYQLWINKSFTPDITTEIMVFLREVCPWNEFERLYLVLLLIILEGWSKYISLLESFGSLLVTLLVTLLL